MRHLFWLFAATAAGALGQADQSVVVAASRTLQIMPDRVAVSASVRASIGQGLDEVVAVLSDAGVRATDLQSVAMPVFAPSLGASGPGPMLIWLFYFTVPVSDIQRVTAALNAANKPDRSVFVVWSIQGALVSDQARTGACSERDLLADARAEAGLVAAASGHRAGQVLALSRPASQSTFLLGSQWYSAALFLTGSIGVISRVDGLIFSPITCAVSVRFALE